jgi:hypothetical protein
LLADLLFIFCTWHAYAKLRLHTSSTLQSLDETTSLLGRVIRRFVKEICSVYTTKELPVEVAARVRRQANNIVKGKNITASKRTRSVAKGKASEVGAGARIVQFNLDTYKLHALGDYVAAIYHFGPTDNYSTQVVCFLYTICYKSANVENRVNLNINA